MKRIYCLIGLLVLIPMRLVSCSEDEVLTEVNTQSEPALQVNTEEKALETCSKLMEAFKKAATRGANSIYPDYYGGCFINDQKELVVLTTEENGEMQIMSLVNADNIVFKSCKYSYNYLKQVIAELNNYQQNNDNDISNNFLVYYLSESQNAIIVEMQECYPSKIDEFKRNVSDSPAIQFKQAIGKPRDLGMQKETENTDISAKETSSLYAGYPITGNYKSGINTYVEKASLGFRVSCNNIQGFMTTGHAVTLGQDVKADGEKIGVCDLYDYYEGGTVDAAFIKVDNPYILTNRFGTTPGSNLIPGFVDESLLREGAEVIKFGATTGYSTGKIVSTDMNVTSKLPDGTKRRVTYQISTTLSADSGDSGGPVLLCSSYLVTGIIKAESLTDNTTIFTRASEIEKRFHCERY